MSVHDLQHRSEAGQERVCIHGACGSNSKSFPSRMIPLVFTLIASWFTLNAHDAIFRRAPVLWCKIHDDSTPQRGDIIPFSAVDFVAVAIDPIALVRIIYTSRMYWIEAGMVIAVVTVVAFSDRTFFPTVLGVVLTGAVLLPLGVVGLVWLFWLSLRVVSWGPIYVLAFFPLPMGYFPLTQISVTDMDQLAAVLGVGFIAAFRSGRCIFKALQSRAGSAASTTDERQPLLAPSQSTTSA
ncbi:hypothetical protein C8R45DRAFT_929478 [Mycena sanguinolenta]|nr:hypothetical protein C8R45DRAFT_929478 [Mycena sanguinolenta]